MSFATGARVALLKPTAAPVVVNYDTDALAVFAAFTTPPTTPVKDAINTFVLALKAGANVWSTLFAFQTTVTSVDEQGGLINFKDPGTLYTKSGSPTWAQNGWTGNAASSGYLNTHVADQSQDSFTIGVAVEAADAAFLPDIGHTTGASLRLFPQVTSTTAAYRVHMASTATVTSILTKLGTSVISRTAITTSNFYRNGVVQGSGSALTSSATAGADITIFKSSSGFSEDRVSMSVIATGWDATQNSEFYAAWATLRTAMGL